MNVAALIVAGISLFVSVFAVRYARASARAAQAVAGIEGARFAQEAELSQSARLTLAEVKHGAAEYIQVRNIGASTAFDVCLAYNGLLFRTLMEDDEAGIDVRPGETVELLPLIDWDHPHNAHMRDHRSGGRMGVPGFPLDLSWVDGLGPHTERRRVEPLHDAPPAHD